jgi:hypothetical protein
MADPALRAEIAKGAALSTVETNDRSAPLTGTRRISVHNFPPVFRYTNSLFHTFATTFALIASSSTGH